MINLIAVEQYCKHTEMESTERVKQVIQFQQYVVE